MEEQRATRHMNFERIYGRPAPDAQANPISEPEPPDLSGSSTTNGSEILLRSFDEHDKTKVTEMPAKADQTGSQEAVIDDHRRLYEEFEFERPSDEDLLKLWLETVPADPYRRNRVQIRVLQQKPEGTFWSRSEIEARTDQDLEEEVLSEAKRWAFAKWESEKLFPLRSGLVGP